MIRIDIASADMIATAAADLWRQVKLPMQSPSIVWASVRRSRAARDHLVPATLPSRRSLAENISTPQPQKETG